MVNQSVDLFITSHINPTGALLYKKGFHPYLGIASLIHFPARESDGYFIKMILIVMKSKINVFEKKIIILPYWLKFIGVGILIMCSIAASFYDINEIDFLSNLRDLIVTIGLLSIILSKEKVEYETLNKVRFYSLLSSFIGGTLVYQISLLFNMSMFKEINPSYLSAYILALYIFFFYSFKRKLKR